VGEGPDDYIHCVELKKREGLPKLVLVHGYGAGGGVFYRIINDLADYFHLFVVDLLGMGSSGRPTFEAPSVELAEDFFVNSLKQFIDLTLKGEKFFLAGHSLGGYLAAVYALRYEDDLLKLLLLSPVGLPEKPDDFTHQEIVDRFDTWKGRTYAKAAMYLWDKKVTPFGPMRAMGSWGTKAFLNFYLKNRMDAITDKAERKEMKRYLHQIFLRPASGEHAISSILEPGSWARKPLFNRIQTLQTIDVSFFYGDRDWMDPAAAIHITESQMLKGSRLYFIQDADHHLYLDNPRDTIYKLLLDVFGEETAARYQGGAERTQAT